MLETNDRRHGLPNGPDVHAGLDMGHGPSHPIRPRRRNLPSSGRLSSVACASSPEVFVRAYLRQRASVSSDVAESE